MLSPLEEHNKLIEKIKHTKQYDPELSATRIAHRHKTAISFVKQVLQGDVKLYPGYYRKLAKRYKLDVEEVQSRMESGQRYCLRCETWTSNKEFYLQSQGSWRHMPVHCNVRKNKND